MFAKKIGERNVKILSDFKPGFAKIKPNESFQVADISSAKLPL